MFISDHMFVECDEYSMIVGNTYLVNSDRTGYFLGTYKGYRHLFTPIFVFENSQFYVRTNQGVLVASGKPYKTEIVVDATSATVRKCK